MCSSPEVYLLTVPLRGVGGEVHDLGRGNELCRLHYHKLKLNISFIINVDKKPLSLAVPVILTKRNHTYFSYHFIVVAGIFECCQHLSLCPNHSSH